MAEIEGALVSLESVKEAIVVAREDVPGHPRLIAYVVPATPPGPTVSTLRRLLGERVPEYMLPAVFVPLAALPLLPNGKVDRGAVPLPGPARPALESPFVAPRTPLEEAVAAIWGEVLKVEQIGIHDNFFELGGNSLSATQVLSRARNALQVEVSLRSLFEKPTLGEFAEVVTQSLAKSRAQETPDSR